MKYRLLSIKFETADFVLVKSHVMKYYDFCLDTAYCLQNCSSDFVLKLYFFCVESRTLETGDFDFGYESCYQVLCNCLQNCSSDFILKFYFLKILLAELFWIYKKKEEEPRIVSSFSRPKVLTCVNVITFCPFSSSILQ